MRPDDSFPRAPSRATDTHRFSCRFCCLDFSVAFQIDTTTANGKCIPSHCRSESPDDMDERPLFCNCAHVLGHMRLVPTL